MSQFLPSFIIAYSNSDFTNPHEVILPDEPKDCTADFTHMGVKYWGMETKRHKATTIDERNKKIYYDQEAHHWLRIGFKPRAKITNLRVSTKWFTGNQVRVISVILIDELTGEEQEVLHKKILRPDQEHHFLFESTTATECLINMYYEGGIARINFFGEKTETQLPVLQNILTKATISNVSNEHYGNPAMAVNGSRQEMYMKGWESARTGFGEQAIFHLEQPTLIREIVVDTYLHRLNAPLSCHVFGMLLKEEKAFEDALNALPKWTLKFQDGTIVNPENFQQYMLTQEYLNENILNPFQFEIVLDNPPGSPWKAVLPFEALRPDTFHRFATFENQGPFSHLLYLHYPNGGVHGLGVYG